MKETEMKRVPKLRFPEFTDDWEQRKLGELTEIKDSARIPNNEWTESGVPYIRASDVTNEDMRGVLFISEEKYKFYKSRTGAPEQGDVLFNGGGEIGKTMLNTGNKPIYVQGGAVLYARTSASKMLNGRYMKTYFETSSAKSYIDAASAGGTMKHFTLKPSQEMPIMFPTMSEQQKIGQYFSNLDHLITLHQRKLEKLKKLRKGMMQKLFSQEIRFKADDGSGFSEWEEKKVGSLGDIVGGGTPSTKKKEYWCGKIAWVSSADIGDNDIRNINITRFITREAIADSATKIIPKDSILIVSRVGVGKVAKASCNLCTSQDFTNIVNLDGDVTFLSYAVLRLMQSKLQCVQGTSIKGIPNDEIKNYTLNIPCLAEQQKIANCLSSLDGVIEKQKATLAAWEELKKGLLQQMFV